MVPHELPENKYYIFGKEGGKKLAESMDVPLLGQIPLVQGICNSGDKGHPVALDDSPVGNSFMALADELILKVEKRNKELKPTVKVQMNK